MCCNYRKVLKLFKMPAALCITVYIGSIHEIYSDLLLKNKKVKMSVNQILLLSHPTTLLVSAG